MCPWDPHASFLAGQQISISLAVSKNSIDFPRFFWTSFNYSECIRNYNGRPPVAIVEVVVDLDRSLPSFVSDSAEWTFAVAVTQTRCGRRRMMQKPGRLELPLLPAANNQNQTSLPSVSLPCLLLVSHPLDPKCSGRLAWAGLSSALPIICFPIIIP